MVGQVSNYISEDQKFNLPPTESSEERKTTQSQTDVQQMTELPNKQLVIYNNKNNNNACIA